MLGSSWSIDGEGALCSCRVGCGNGCLGGSGVVAKYFVGLLLVLLVAIGWFVYHNPDWFRLSSVSISGDFVQLSERDLMDKVRPMLVGSLWQIEVGKIRKRLQAEPWVKRVLVKRQLPRHLVIKVRERVPVAVWGKDALLDQSGEIFRPGNGTDWSKTLPTFSGPEQKVKQVLLRCQHFRESLSARGLTLTGCDVNGRGAWHLQLTQGVDIILGAQDIEQRFALFSQVYEHLLIKFPRGFSRVDMRYQHGLVVS